MKNQQKLVCCIMGQNCQKFIGMCLESCKDADEIVYCDGGSIDNTLEKAKGFLGYENFVEVIKNKYDQEDPKMNGRQRNFYLQYLKENYKGYFCLVLDADEVVDDRGIQKIKKFINILPKQNHDILFSPKMRHLIGDLGHEDSTQPIHFVPHRLFKIRDDLKYPEVEHSVLLCSETRSQNLMLTTIWHMAYCPNMWSIKKRYENHLKKSNMHTPEFLKNWYWQHLFGQYPKTQFNIIDLPKFILNEFGIDKDELYFHDRQKMEAKHYQDAIDWKEEFDLDNALLFGCGFGQRVFALRKIGVNAKGVEISKYAVDNCIFPTHVMQGNICDETIDLFIIQGLDGIPTYGFDLVTAYDILEHLKYEDLDTAITTMFNKCNKYILISVPFKGTPNCDADPTHIIKESKEWWVERFEEKNCKLIETPSHFLYKEQILIFQKGDKK